MLLTVNDKDYLLDERSLTFEALLRCYELEEQIRNTPLERFTASDLYQFNEFVAECFRGCRITVQELNERPPADVLANVAELILECRQILPKIEKKIYSVGNNSLTDNRPAVKSDYELLLRIISDLISAGEDLVQVLHWPVMRYFDIIYYRCLESKRSELAPAELIDQLLGI